MKIITPTTIVNGMLDYSNVPEIQNPTGGYTEPTEYDSATAYTIGQEVSVVLGTDTASITHGVYESTLDGTNTGNDPTLATDLTNWKFVRSTIRWAMFNQILQDQTTIATARQNGLTLAGGAGNYANSPDITFPLEKITIIVKLTPTDATPALDGAIFAKYVEAADQRTIVLKLLTTGFLEITVSPDGTSAAEISYVSTNISQLTDATAGWIKIEFDGDNGANSSADFYDSLEALDSEDLVTWTQLGAPILSTQTSLFDSTALLEMGGSNAGANDNFVGSIQQVVIYDGIVADTRTLVSDYNRIDDVTTGTSTSWRTGQVWTDQGTAAFTRDISGILVEIDVGSLQNSMAFMNVDATTIQLIGKDATEGEVYNQSFNLLSTNGIDGMYAWLFTALTFDKNLVIFGLPAYASATFRAIISAPTTAKCGAMVVGNEFTIGATSYGARYGIENYSTKVTDAVTGSVTISAGTFKSISDVNIVLDSSRFTITLDTLTELRDIPVVWVGSEFVSGMIQYGYYRSFSEIYSNYSQATCLMEIEGLS